MSLLNTSISESIDSDLSSSMSLNKNFSNNNGEIESNRSSGIKKRVKGKQVSEKNKVIAACSGAIVTSITMTPFDVIKTRLQTQVPGEPLFRPSSHLPPPSLPSTSPWPIPIASTSKVPIPSPTVSSSGSSTATAASNLTTCCQKTYFSSNLADSLLCRFDPRTSTAALLPQLKPKSISYPKQSSSLSIPRIHPSSIPPLPSSSNLTLASSSNVCLYPNSASATLALPTNSTPTSTRHLTGFWDALVKIVRYEGLSALWRGTGPALAMSVPGQVVYMVGYDWGRRTAFEFAPSWAYVPRKNINTIKGLRNEDRKLRASYLTAVPLFAGGLSRTFVAAIVSPIELLRTRLQSSTTGTTIPAIFRALQADGWKSAWRGLPATLWRDVPFSGIYWAGYEGIKRTLTGGKGMGEGWEDVGVWEEFRIAFVSGAGSGMIAAVVTNPFDVVKTRRQALDWPTDPSSSSSSSSPSTSPTLSTATGSRTPPKITSTFPMILNIVKTEGWAGIMGGLTPRLAKVMPACGVMIAMYEGLSTRNQEIVPID